MNYIKAYGIILFIMMVALEGVQTTLEPMTPNRGVMWERSETHAGVLYTSSACPRPVIDKVIDLAHRDMFETPFDQDYLNCGPFLSSVGGQKLGTGSFGLALAIDGVAYKKAYSPIYDDCMMGLSALKVNTALSAGLNAIPQLQSSPERTIHGRRPFKITAPDYLAAYLPRVDRHPYRLRPDQSSVVIAMSKEEGSPPSSYGDRPRLLDKQKRMAAAVMHCGLDEKYVNFDDTPENTLVKNDGDNSGLHLVALDAYATMNLGSLFS